MIRMTDLIKESYTRPENRINLMRVQAIMEKILPELSATDAKKLTEMFTEISMMASQLNATAYIRTESSVIAWAVLVESVKVKVNEMKEEVSKLSLDCTTLIKALDEALIN